MEADPELNLDLAKKKKKAKKPFDLDALDNADQNQTEEADTNDLDDLNDLLSSKKKKKKKKAFNLDDLESALPASGETEPVEKQQTEADQNAEAAQDQDLVINDDDLDFNLPLKKKKKKKVTLIEPDLGDSTVDQSVQDGDKENMPVSATTNGQSALQWANSDRDYTYDELLDLVFNIIKEKNPEIAGERKKLVMRPPQVLRVGTKKSSFANFIDICKSVHRQPKHVQAFLLAELGTSGSVDANNQLIIKGRFQQKQIESVLKKYIKEYVSCQTCRSPETILQKDTRLFFLQCETCGSRRSVASIKSGFQAVTGKRAAIRAKTA